ncbi:methyl-accepting chemotaxis sensory transducer [Tenuibacillus multivorans]|uniref:Methyl-accepting chemotaxis protein n=2 Tax=Tenuibacillus multivorans TaxID=237069 RepID=A0A1H0C050_9BACI|nr:methyl-accepting chemotaxis protein [Tenuibacillus multivorans]GEL77712.1 methyl-accepting chemotaxis sensory transducer [Tenuibacillus multivorans]SDN51273.1 methyl-accepting chemotaxis protein [Tenuibacillus multivorans]
MLKRLKNLKLINLKNMNIGWKYGSALGIVIVLFLISTIISATLLLTLSNDIKTMEQSGDDAIDVTQLIVEFRSKDVRIPQFLLTEDESNIPQFEQRRDSFDRLKTELEPELQTSEQRELFNQIIEKDQEYNDIFLNDMVTAIESNQKVEALKLSAQTNSIRAEIDSLLEQLRALINEQRQASINEANTALITTITTLIASLVVSIVLGVIVVYFVNRIVQRNLKQVITTSERMAEGDLAVEDINYNGKDEIGQLATAFNEMKNYLREMVQRVQTVSETVSSQSEELTQSSNEISTGAEQVASTMEELSASSEQQASSANEISKMIKQLDQQIIESNDEGVKLSSQSDKVHQLSTDGRTKIGQSVDQMSAITTLVTNTVEQVNGLNQKSEEISKLIVVIKDIAEQTNLLALNAAIEAARAGESGKGFAVVADEVRKLAEQVEKSISEITGIIQGVQNETKAVTQSLEEGYKQVEQGNEQIRDSRDQFDAINQSISEMTQGIQTISSHLKEVSNNSELMNESISEIASSTEESSAGIEESASTVEEQSASMQEITGSAESLAQSAEELNDLIKRFKL